MESELKQKTAKGLLWGLMNNGTMQLFNAVVGIILAKHLSNADYGLAGEIAVFSAIAAALQESGFIAALTNRRNPTHADYNSVFWFNITCSLLLYAALWFCAPLIARWFGEPELLWLSRYAFVGFFLASFSITPRAILFRQMKVKEQSIVNFTAMLLSSAVGITMALCGMRYWSIVTQSMVYVTVVSALSWAYSGWRPSLQVSWRPVREMFGFSFKLLITNIFNCINNSVFALAFGRFYTKAEVGNYTQADKWNKMGSQLITGMVQGVAQPMFVAVGNDGERLRRVFRKMLRFTSLLSFPAMFGLAMVAPEFIVVLIDARWLPSAQLMQLLCIAGAFMPITTLYFNFLISRGRSDVYLWNIVLQGLLVLAMLCVVKYAQLTFAFTLFSHSVILSGIHLMVVGYVVIYVLWLLVWHWFLRREIRLTLLTALKDMLPFAAIALLVMLATYVLTRSITSLLALLFTRILLAALLYFAVLWLLRVKVLREAVAYLLRNKNK